ncbi:MAG: hypothetical protein HY815_10920 [Candidatus Riflebacteria bacterium]|nr:hypothetical protein [Candidatus Riflebacteria bacterium]
MVNGSWDRTGHGRSHDPRPAAAPRGRLAGQRVTDERHLPGSMDDSSATTPATAAPLALPTAPAAAATEPDRSPDRRGVFGAALGLALLIAATHGPVVFCSRSLLPYQWHPRGTVAAGLPGGAGRAPAPTFNVDLATPACYETPLDRAVGTALRSGTIPHWTGNLACGKPFLAEYSTRVLFPYQILQNLMPTTWWSFLILGRFWVMGLFTVLFLRRVGVPWTASMAGGVFYELGGCTGWFGTLQMMSNPAMTLPMLLWAAAGIVPLASGRAVSTLAVAVALVLLSGQPETALYELTLATLFLITRALGVRGPGGAPRALIPAVIGFLCGLCLAAPQILPFSSASRSGILHSCGSVTSPCSEWSGVSAGPALSGSSPSHAPERWDFRRSWIMRLAASIGQGRRLRRRDPGRRGPGPSASWQSAARRRSRSVTWAWARDPPP